MPKYFYWCEDCGHGFTTRAKDEDFVARILDRENVPPDLGPDVQCGTHRKAMEKLGPYPEGLKAMTERKHLEQIVQTDPLLDDEGREIGQILLEEENPPWDGTLKREPKERPE